MSVGIAFADLAESRRLGEAELQYTTLDAPSIVATAERLHRRIEERFPGSGLSKVAGELVTVASRSGADASLLAEPNRPIRVSVALLLLAGVVFAALAVNNIHINRLTDDPVSIVQATESAMNIAILVGIGVLALTQLESRWKSRRALKSLHTLRSLAHVIDMHQLTKDPGTPDHPIVPTAHSPRRVFTKPQLQRYLDYCSEMLSLVGKLAALYAQCLQDRGITEAVADIELLTNDLSREIWQKISLIEG